MIASHCPHIPRRRGLSYLGTCPAHFSAHFNSFLSTRVSIVALSSGPLQVIENLGLASPLCSESPGSVLARMALPQFVLRDDRPIH